MNEWMNEWMNECMNAWIQNIEDPKLVGTPAIHPVIENWKQEGLSGLNT